MKKILVTGGAGFIGAHTSLELLHAGYEPVLLDDFSRSDRTLLHGLQQISGRNVEFHCVDLKDESQLEAVFAKHQDLNGVIHFAAFKSVSESVENPLLYYHNNIGSLVNLLKVMKKYGINEIIFSSSCTVYGQPDQIPVTEQAPFKRPESAYGATKQMGEQILADQVRANPLLKAISLRYFNPIGAHPSGHMGELPLGVPTNLVPYITQTAVGKRKMLTIHGNDYATPDGSCLRDYIHVVDLAQAHVKAIQLIDEMPTRNEAINIGSGIPVSVLELVKTFIQVSGVDLPYTVGPRRPGDVEKVYADPSKARAILRWSTRYGAADALRDAWRWEQNLCHAPH
ncbi:MAG TPA: UDP-glucose 4-epimerase GalE [Cyclobacteriaceae bacterium]|nr:UDP-glucose 4-epimerase GalE [Cyclobacteriaceae bacterium]